MFEYKDNFLMSPAIDPCDVADCYLFCAIKRDAEEDYDELARLVGEGGMLESSSENDTTGEAAPPAWTDVTEADAPRLEFDLEDELTRAFDGRQSAGASPSLEPDFGTRALHDALAAAEIPANSTPMGEQAIEDVMPSAQVTIAPTETAPAIEVSEPETIDLTGADPLAEGAFSGLVSQELEKARTEFEEDSVRPAFDKSVNAFAPEPKVEEPDTHETNTANPEDSLEDFSMELARLMGEPDAEPAVDEAAAPPVPPAPTEALMPWQTPEIVQQSSPAAPAVEEVPASKTAPAYESVAYQSSYSSAPNPQLPPAASLEVPPPSVGTNQVEDVLARADAVEAAAVQDTQLDQEFDHDLEAALSRELDAELDIPSDEEAGNGTVVIPPIYMPGADRMAKRQTGRRVAAGIVAIALLGGSAALAWSFVSSDDVDPPTIFASSDPIKIKPKDAGGKVVPNQDQSVYRAVDGKKEDKPTQQKLKDDSEKPIAVATAPATIPVGPKSTANDASQSAATDAPVTGGSIVPPRRVRTVVVRPDGTILTKSPENKPSAVALGDSLTASVPDAPKPVSVKTISTPAPKTDVAGSGVLTATDANSGSNAEKMVAATEQPTKKVDAALLSQSPKEVETKPAAPAKTQTAAQKPAPKPVKVAKIEPVKPVLKKPEETVGADPLAPSQSSSAYAVQVSSQRSPEAAKKSYNSLARRFASVIGGKGVVYQKSLVKGKEYYRVRIPAASKAAAQKICGQLKAKGGDCFVTR